MSLLQASWPGLTVLRILRVFRVLRIFSRLQSLRMIVRSLTTAIPALLSALAVVFLISCVYTILGVQLFKNEGIVFFQDFSSSFLTVTRFDCLREDLSLSLNLYFLDQIFKISTFDSISDDLDTLETCCGAGGVLFLVSFIMV